MLVFVILLVLAALYLLYKVAAQIVEMVGRGKAPRPRDFYIKFLAKLMGLFLTTGTILYLYVFYVIGTDMDLMREVGHPVQFSLAEWIFRALICSVDLFLLDVDTNILDRLDSFPLLKGLLSLQAFLSFGCTVAMVAGLVYTRLVAYWRLNYRTKVSPEKDHLYLFFGYGTPTQLLVKEVVREDPKAVVVIIDEANVKEEEQSDWERVIGFLSHRGGVFREAREKGARVAVASQMPADIDPKVVSEEKFDALGYMGLGKIKKLIEDLGTLYSKPGEETPQGSSAATAPAEGERAATTSEGTKPENKYDGPKGELHIFFMGEDEDRNIANIRALAKDTTILSMAKNETITHHIYCHARYNGPNRVIQDLGVRKKLDIRIFDSSHLAVELLKMRGDSHPVNVVPSSSLSPVKVEESFRALIVGFGEVGRDAFRFLYEFGAFVDSADPSRRSPFKCIVADRNMDSLKGTFMASMPAIFGEGPANVDIDLVSADIHDTAFSEAIEKDDFIEKVNYIVISIGDGGEGMALATRLFSRVRKAREDLSDLRIFVRCPDGKDAEVMRRIAEHYNRGYGKGRGNEEVIRVFGVPEEIYTFDLVVSDRLTEQAKVYYDEYRKHSGEKQTWEGRRKELAGTEIPDIDKLRKLRRKESQDYANVLHSSTKLTFLRRALGHLAATTGWNLDRDSFLARFFKPDGSVRMEGGYEDIHYPQLKELDSIFLALAQLEHLRWMASHELMGYRVNDDDHYCDERRMRHNCLRPWSDLDKESRDAGTDYKWYDFIVVNTTIALNRDSLETNIGSQEENIIPGDATADSQEERKI